jgi:hypothetical protein
VDLPDPPQWRGDSLGPGRIADVGLVVAVTLLTVDFAGERFDVSDAITFGRAGEIELDTNRHLHRLVGEFALRDGIWWLTNLGSRVFLTLVTADGSRTDLAPGASQTLASGTGTVRLVVGTARYQLDYSIDSAGVPEAAPWPPPDPLPADGRTVDFEAVLTPREIDFMVTFARRLMEGEHGQLPSYVEVAELWGVSPKTLDNTVQIFKRKMRNARLATDEPLDALVRIAVAHSLITPADLEWAFGAGAPRPAVDGPRFRRGPARAPAGSD